MNQITDLYKPIVSNRPGQGPLVLKVIVSNNNDMIAGGVPTSSNKVENYILLSALPIELRQRVELAVQAMIQGM